MKAAADLSGRVAVYLCSWWGESDSSGKDDFFFGEVERGDFFLQERQHRHVERDLDAVAEFHIGHRLFSSAHAREEILPVRGDAVTLSPATFVGVPLRGVTVTPSKPNSQTGPCRVMVPSSPRMAGSVG